MKSLTTRNIQIQKQVRRALAKASAVKSKPEPAGKKARKNAK